jgi:hypothetical protein
MGRASRSRVFLVTFIMVFVAVLAVNVVIWLTGSTRGFLEMLSVAALAAAVCGAVGGVAAAWFLSAPGGPSGGS